MRELNKSSGYNKFMSKIKTHVNYDCAEDFIGTALFTK